MVTGASVMNGLDAFEELESEVRSYVRGWPTVFDRAYGAKLWDENGREYLDFFSGAGGLNYGHNHDAMIGALVRYLQSQGVLHSLDMATTAKRDFLERFHEIILKPRGLSYRVMFPGPTGTNAVEASLKLARKVTGRADIVSFSNAFHGMTLGSLALSGNVVKRESAGIPLEHQRTAPFDGELGESVDTIAVLDAMLAEEGASVAGVIVETIQGEGGLHTASFDWLQRLAECCKRHGCLLIVDDIQAGCGRSGSFFSFEPAGIEPDIICLSKSISGSGLPMALTLIRPELDIWGPGEHNGTFRGNNAAFVTATEALRFWRDESLAEQVCRKSDIVRAELDSIASQHEAMRATVRGRGLLIGLHTPIDGLASGVARAAFERGLLIETSGGAASDVIKLMPPLTIEDEQLERGLAILRDSVEVCAP
ncbi:MAG: diaminobutyrate--2-oxoglutarate transaminase [Chloroflexi bacterium]|nr:diaminobutyrate--2-oxoglutarate transaminase [Chloroflexota bacterium]MCY3697883.1 diaminobutyrate--2-oxoglutarate transaminase [Chloroflexota bacterium]